MLTSTTVAVTTMSRRRIHVGFMYARGCVCTRIITDRFAFLSCEHTYQCIVSFTKIKKCLALLSCDAVHEEDQVLDKLQHSWWQWGGRRELRQHRFLSSYGVAEVSCVHGVSFYCLLRLKQKPYPPAARTSCQAYGHS